LIDNRLDVALAQWSCSEQKAERPEYRCNLAALANALVPHQAGALAIHDLHFGYLQGRTIFQAPI